jgi:carbon monoxide dehydrogenase subunit G
VKIEGSYALQAPRDRGFALLVDEDVLRRCIPGCRRLVRESDETFAATLEVGIGSVQGTYEGTVKLSEMVPPERLELIVEGKGNLGFVRGKGTLRLEETKQEAGRTLTTIFYRGDLQIGGAIAGVGQRMFQSAAKMTAGQFFAAIEAEAKAAESSVATPVKHGFLRNFFRWLRSMLRNIFRRPARNA